MSACGRWAAVDDTGPDAAYAMSYSLPRRGYAAQHMLHEHIDCMNEHGHMPYVQCISLRGNEHGIAYAASGPVSSTAAHLPHADMTSLPGARVTHVSGQWHAS